MAYYDNANRKRIYGQPKDVKGILEYFYPEYNVIENWLDDLTKTSYPDFTLIHKTNWSKFNLEWQEFHLYMDCIPIKQTKTRFWNAICNFNRSNGLLCFITPEMIKERKLRDIWIIPALRKYNETKMGYFIPKSITNRYRVPEEIYNKTKINIIPCESQLNGTNFHKL